MSTIGRHALEARRRAMNGHYVRVVREGKREVGRECPRCGGLFPRRGPLRGPSRSDSLAAKVIES